jgi:type III restriction enzyme
MLSLKKYQQKAVEGLIDDTFTLLAAPDRRKKMVFKAPTGAGKTVMTAAYMARLADEMAERTDLRRNRVAFIWIAPNKLHQQSLASFRRLFADSRLLNPIEFEGVTGGALAHRDVLFLNWQSVNKDSNVYVRDNEQDRTLGQYVQRTYGQETELIIILDEAHLFAAKGPRAGELLARLNAKIEVDVSATPEFRSDYGYTVKRPEVVAAQMIKKQVVLNPALDAARQDGRTLTAVLLEEALAQRQRLREAYGRLGVAINPLLLIQLPNDRADLSPEDGRIRDELTGLLRDEYGITTQNGRLAVWLSDAKDKVNLDGIEAPASPVDVLLFKQAIALGWDCPRAGVLLIFRELKQETFTIQTVGRILRMPEQKHYPDELLNNGYVYTNLSRNIIEVVADDMDYIVQYRATRRADIADTLLLQSAHINTRLVRNRLGSKFGRCLAQASAQLWSFSLDDRDGRTYHEANRQELRNRLLNLDVTNIEIPLPKDVVLTGEEELVDAGHVARFAKTTGELHSLFYQFCRQHTGGYAPADSTPILSMALVQWSEEYLNYVETDTHKLVLLEQNRPRFVELIETALERYRQLMDEEAKKATRRVEYNPWNVPVERAYTEHYVEQPAVRHALEPFYQYKSASGPEQQFVQFLEAHEASLDWWYKNGDSGPTHFAVSYEKTDGRAALFYVDFVLKLNDGTLALFDTKTPDSDPDMVAKHNALYAYLEGLSGQGQRVVGGILLAKGTGSDRRWVYPSGPITSGGDTSGWLTFYPTDYK